MVNLKFDETEVSQVSNKIFEKTKKGLGFVPNMYQKMGNNSALLDAYTYSYNTFRVNSGFTPIEQEGVFLSVAYENNCEYCMAAHSFVADAISKVPENVTDAIRNDTSIPDNKLAELVKFTRTMVKTRGLPKVADVDDFLGAGYSEHRVLDIIQAISVKTISNYANHLFHTELDDVFKKREWQAP